MKIPKRILSEHLDDLKKSGVSKKFAQSNGLYSVDRQGLSRLMEKSVNPKIKSALIFPYPHAGDFFRAKLFPPSADANGKKIKYLQPAGSGAHFYIPPSLVRDSLKDPLQALYIIEGEKKVLSAIEKGLTKCIGIGGIWNGIKDQKPIEDFALVNWKDCIVFYVPDSEVWSDDHKLKSVFAFCKFMEDAGAEVKIVRLPTVQGINKTGLDDYFSQNSLDDFYQLPQINLSHEVFLGLEDWFHEWRNKSEKRNKEEDISLNSHISLYLSAKDWPKPLPLEDFYGLAGDFVRLADPATEADPIAIYIQLLALFGNVIGRTAHFIAEQDKHYMNLFAVLVGETSKARKGSSWSQVKKAFGFLEDDWLKDHLSSGLSSGEGLIWAVRDPIEKTEPIREKSSKEIIGHRTITADPGIQDKRLIVYEPEFASVLRVLEREGNTLSAQIRQAWESGTLRTLTKNSPAKATGAHISTLGHITRDELRRYLNLTEAASGFGNRFLWFCVRRSKTLPEGGSYDEFKMMKLFNRIKSAIKFASKVERMQRSDKAREHWREIYPKLSEGKPGMLGAVTGRAEAQVMRLSCLFALLDESKIVEEHHLKAAVRLWDFAYQSAEHIFGKSLGDDVADRIYAELVSKGPQGMTLSEISALFSHHKGKERIHSVLQSLFSLGLAVAEKQQTGGRNAQVIKAIIK